MKAFFDTVIAWIKGNLWLSIGILAVILFVLFPRQIKKMFVSSPRRKRVVHQVKTSSRRRIPRSVGLRKVNKPSYNKNGTKKKPWQIKGSPAARRRMAQIRRKR